LTDLKNRYPEKQLRLDLMLAELYSAQKEYQRAFDLLTVALQKNPGQRELLYTRAMVAEKLDKFDVLESDLQLLLQQNPDDANALNALGYILVDRTDRYQEAEGYLRRAIALEPDATVIIDSYGWLLFKQGDTQQALEYLQRAYKQEQEGEIAAHLIEVLWVSGQHNDARDLMEQALETVEDKVPLYKLLKRIPGLK
jgi:Tfp pilus assembly protein PilF